MTIFRITQPTQDPPLWPALPPSQTRGWGRWSVRGGCSLVVKRQPRDSRRGGPSFLHPSSEHSLLSSSGVTGKVAMSTSKQEREQVGWVLGQGDMRESFPNLHHDSEM